MISRCFPLQDMLIFPVLTASTVTDASSLMLHAGAADDLDDHGKAEVAILFCSCDEFFVFGAHHLFFLRIDVVWLGLEDRDETVVPACVSEEAVKAMSPCCWRWTACIWLRDVFCSGSRILW